MVFLLITIRKRSLGQGNVFTLVCHSVRGWGLVGFLACLTGHMTGGVCPRGGMSASRGVLHPGGLHLGRGGSASRGVGQTPHGILQDMVNKQAVCILLECILVYF